VNPDCTPRQLEFQGWGGGCRRRVVARFDGGTLSSDGGVVLLGEVERRLGILRRFAEGFSDHRDPATTEHSVYELVAQRVLGLALAIAIGASRWPARVRCSVSYGNLPLRAPTADCADLGHVEGLGSREIGRRMTSRPRGRSRPEWTSSSAARSPTTEAPHS
jgi:hypothetical protein